jgi:hypothetical protein
MGMNEEERKRGLGRKFGEGNFRFSRSAGCQLCVGYWAGFTVRPGKTFILGHPYGMPKLGFISISKDL